LLPAAALGDGDDDTDVEGDRDSSLEADRVTGALRLALVDARGEPLALGGPEREGVRDPPPAETVGAMALGVAARTLGVGGILALVSALGVPTPDCVCAAAVGVCASDASADGDGDPDAERDATDDVLTAGETDAERRAVNDAVEYPVGLCDAGPEADAAPPGLGVGPPVAVRQRAAGRRRARSGGRS